MRQLRNSWRISCCRITSRLNRSTKTSPDVSIFPILLKYISEMFAVGSVEDVATKTVAHCMSRNAANFIDEKDFKKSSYKVQTKNMFKRNVII